MGDGVDGVGELEENKVNGSRGRIRLEGGV